jgi:serine/threonine-protein kinase
MIGRIGKYTVEKELGQGGFGKVYLALDPDVGQPVAIKKLLTEGDPDLLKRFQLEIRTTAALRHKNIVTIHASGEDEGHPYLVMEFLEGRTLKQIIQGRVPLSLLDKVRIMTQVAEGLAYAHSKGVVHRDVKPENIMLLPDDNVKIMDFGIALGPNRNTNVTQTGGIIGTPSYFAPEQLEGYKASEQTDIFSFGDVFYELLTGINPFEQ